MIEIHRSAIVLASPETLYDLINDVESYPEFLDGISSGKVLESSETSMLGQIVIKKLGVERTIVTRNKLTKASSIEMTLEKGPLDNLHGVWSIKALGDTGCKVSLDLTFGAQKGLKAMAFSVLFKQVADNMVDAFVKRAQISR